MVLGEGLRLFKVARPKNNQNYPEVGYNEIVVVAKNENQAKGIALNSTCSLIDSYRIKGGVTKKDLLITDITDELVLGYVVSKS